MRPEGPRGERMKRGLVTKVIAYVTLTIGAVIGLFPLYWCWMLSLRPDGWEFTFPPVWLPEYWLWGNYIRAWNSGPFLIYTRNSLTITLVATLGTILSGSLSAFAFSR